MIAIGTRVSAYQLLEDELFLLTVLLTEEMGSAACCLSHQFELYCI
jgi:hypothetical protein